MLLSHLKYFTVVHANVIVKRLNALNAVLNFTISLSSMCYKVILAYSRLLARAEKEQQLVVALDGAWGTPDRNITIFHMLIFLAKMFTYYKMESNLKNINSICSSCYETFKK